jgi:carboxyl-terminal processing protease
MRLRYKLILAGAMVAVLSIGAFAAEEDRFGPLKRFIQVMDLIESNYVKPASRAELIDGAIVGMLQQLDPHSSFMTKEEFKEMQVSTSGEFSGVGIEISLENGRLVVIAPIDDTPADKAGIKAGDAIIEIEGVPTQDMTLVEAVSKIRGPKGKAVTLTVVHKNSQKPDKVRVVRDTIPIISVKLTELDDGFVLLRLTRFNENTDSEMRDMLGNYQKGGKQIKGIVLDMRNNPGGLLDTAVKVSDAFLTKGKIVSIKGKADNLQKEYEAKSSGAKFDAPMAVLINAGSASAAEIVAGALQDHKRALLIGEKSFGKGSVQTVIPLADGSGIKLTTALYYTPKGRSIQAEGIEPDLKVPLQETAAMEKDIFGSGHRFRERDLRRHLENGSKKKSDSSDSKQRAKEMLDKDNQLSLALDLLKKRFVSVN